jgi:transcriptional regulator with XRE-family HTH domain
MRRHDVSQSELASFLNVNKGTISRSLSSGSFSPSLRNRAAKLLNSASCDENEDRAVQESLRLLFECAMLLDAARALMARALDLVERKH